MGVPSLNDLAVDGTLNTNKQTYLMVSKINDLFFISSSVFLLYVGWLV